MSTGRAHSIDFFIHLNLTKMNINLKTSGITTTPAISEYLNKRLKKLDKLIDNESVICDVEIGRTTAHHNKGDIFRAEIHIVGAGRDIYASSEKEDLYVAIDDTSDEVLQMIKSDKKKSTSLIRRGGARVKAMVKGLWPWK
jgi:ribosomal subunit interface protein